MKIRTVAIFQRLFAGAAVAVGLLTTPINGFGQSVTLMVTPEFGDWLVNLSVANTDDSGVSIVGVGVHIPSGSDIPSFGLPGGWFDDGGGAFYNNNWTAISPANALEFGDVLGGFIARDNGSVDSPTSIDWIIRTVDVTGTMGSVTGTAIALDVFDPPPGMEIDVNGMTPAGDLVGVLEEHVPDRNHGFVRTPGGPFTIFDAPGALHTEPKSVNALGAITGNLEPSLGFTRGFIRTPADQYTVFEIPLMYVSPSSINDLGQVAGAVGTDRGFVRDVTGSIDVFDVPGASIVWVEEINNAGQAVGWFFGGPGNLGGFLREPNGTVQTINAPPNGDSLSANGINDSGEIVGSFTDFSDPALPRNRAFVRAADGQIDVFDAPGAEYTAAVAINEIGQIAGSFWDGTGDQHGFIRDSDGSFTVISSPRGDGVRLRLLNDAGQVAGELDLPSGLSQGFLWSPSDSNSPDGTVDLAGGTVSDDVYGSRAQVTFPPGVVAVSTDVTIEVYDDPPGVPTPEGFEASGTLFVEIDLDPTPSFPLAPPGLTIVLPTDGPMPAGNILFLFRLNPTTGLLETAVSVFGSPVVGIVDASGSSATFTGIRELSTIVGLLPEVILVDIDVSPGSDQNAINLASNGVTSIAILSSTSFDATTVDPATVIVAAAQVRLLGNGSPMASARDVNQDGLVDLVVQVSTNTFDIVAGQDTVTLTGRTFGELPIQGEGVIRIVPD